MAFGYGTWDANGNDNNTGLVRINALGTMTINASGNYNQAFSLPSGYVLDFLFQPTGEPSSTNARKTIAVSGSSIVVTQVSSSNYSNGTFPNVPGIILAFARL
ncbi:hypothetical protein [Pantoea sp. GM01]|uniref:hypothetical protein n=1 Tax=Pantoea sp. GM01 TaxID=1144320 RepID=UPI0008FB2BBC|nr:hypothetical protein [Pantoea sp. GM01]